MKIKNIKIDGKYTLKSRNECTCLDVESEATHPGDHIDTVQVLAIDGMRNTVRVTGCDDWIPCEWLRKRTHLKVSKHDLLIEAWKDLGTKFYNETGAVDYDAALKYHVEQTQQKELEEKIKDHLDKYPITIEYFSEYGTEYDKDTYHCYSAFCQHPHNDDEGLETNGDTPEEALDGMMKELRGLL